uniref:Uncharacterized protein n=1 Tax=Arundo donax TaxID=35708 RepID=A0A0A8Z633_ARUDO
MEEVAASGRAQWRLMLIPGLS